MTTQILIEKIKKIEQELIKIKQPKSILGKIHVDEKILEQTKKAIFDFDIEKFVSKKDLKKWK